MGRNLLLYPHPILRETCTPFDFTNPKHIALAEEMRTMVGPDHGRGLAAPQLGVAIALFATCFQPKTPFAILTSARASDFKQDTSIAMSPLMIQGRGARRSRLSKTGVIGGEEGGNLGLKPPTLYINPKITHFSNETITLSEGCRSLPWFTVDVERPLSITIEATDLNGNSFTHNLDGWESRVVQHEQDHLSGILNIDRIPEIERYKLDVPI